MAFDGVALLPQQVFDDALDGKATANFEFPLYTKVGRRVDVLLNANPRRDERDRVYGVVGVGQVWTPTPLSFLWDFLPRLSPSRDHGFHVAATPLSLSDRT